MACATEDHSAIAEGSSAAAADNGSAAALLDALDAWLRDKTIENILPRQQAKALLIDLRDDRRFWAQQRRQFAIVWTNIEVAMRVETRPLSIVMGDESCARFLDAVEQMDDDPALVRAVLRSELIESVLGKILYEAIMEFVQQADLLGTVINQLPVIGAIRMQMLTAARKQLDILLGPQIKRFLGEYTAAAADSAAVKLLSPETEGQRRRARRKLGKKVLAKPISELFTISDIEMVLVRDAVWLAVQEFRLPDEQELVDKLYDEFGQQPFTIMLPSTSAMSKGDAPFFERGQSVLLSVLERFLASDEWGTWLETRVDMSLGTEGAVQRRELPERSAAAKQQQLEEKWQQPPTVRGELTQRQQQQKQPGVDPSGVEQAAEPEEASDEAEGVASWDGWD
eukprot:CAMPEP_0174700392 /NCGR_PEP_ID=MMETSP1094-20130205/5352_1 /TAXON_ID=156173 /ORGANISM="Chrysochromulina brevifilum, Strain UTEX LB 985" /LENGTH=396 /DNA_ID=CAMNT_0015897861 /DNA_START=287 /DNA_END=1477 /DNA_ORIENTATION=+